MNTSTALALVVSPRTGDILRKVTITTFEEAAALSKKWPNCDIGLFLGGDPEGDNWCYWPEFHRDELRRFR